MRKVAITVSMLAMLLCLYSGVQYLKTQDINIKAIKTNFSMPSIDVSKTIDGVVHIVNVTKGWQGSGFVVTPSLIATARHVVEEGIDFKITLNDGTEIMATRALSSKKHDVGFIKLDEPILQPLKLGSVFDCKVGQFLYAIGSPYGKINQNSVTFGIVSSLKRNFDIVDRDYGWGTLFQTDAAGHPGNSGCPVFTLDGKVRGVLVGGFSNALIYCVPVDVFMHDIEVVEQLFELDRYYFEKSAIEAMFEYYRN